MYLIRCIRLCLRSPRWRWSSVVVLILSLLAARIAFRDGGKAEISHSDPVFQVVATTETESVRDRGDAADDPCIWVHPADPSQSTIIGTNKKRGLVVYDLSGKAIQHVTAGKLNNVDVRYGFPLGGRRVDIVCSENRANNTVLIFRIDPETRQLTRVDTGTIQPTGGPVYGCCLYHDRTDGKHYVFVGSKSGVAEQWQLFEDRDKQVSGKMVRSFDVGATVEGCVTDDELGHLYIAEEMVGIWKYRADPDGGMARSLVDSTTDPKGHVRPQAEGLAIYYGPHGTGYLIASSQRNDEFVVYRREGRNEYVATFEVLGQNRIDSVTHTDGIDVTSCHLGSAFPFGLFVAQDHSNGELNQNFKFISWQAIAQTISPPLTIDASRNPRL